MKQQLENIEKMALAALDEAKESAELENLRVRFLGKRVNSLHCSKRWAPFPPRSAR